jgi:hypothetical protein
LRVRVDRPTRADQDVPPTAPIRVALVPGGVRVPRQGVADHHRVRALGVQRAVGLVRHVDRREAHAAVEDERILVGEQADAAALRAADTGAGGRDEPALVGLDGAVGHARVQGRPGRSGSVVAPVVTCGGARRAAKPDS